MAENIFHNKRAPGVFILAINLIAAYVCILDPMIDVWRAIPEIDYSLKGVLFPPFGITLGLTLYFIPPNPDAGRDWFKYLTRTQKILFWLCLLAGIGAAALSAWGFETFMSAHGYTTRKY
jgi:hypothetical protein